MFHLMRIGIVALLGFSIATTNTQAKDSKDPELKKRPDRSAEMTRIQTQVAEKIRKTLASSTNYGVFDNLTYQIQGAKVILGGQVVRPTLRSEAEARVKDIEGVASVDNRIEVLPVSPHDDEIRLRAYQTIFGHPQMTRYANQPVPPIHIIVKNGNIQLEGIVANKGDKDMAGILANEVPSVFSVKNNLQVEGSSK